APTAAAVRLGDAGSARSTGPRDQRVSRVDRADQIGPRHLSLSSYRCSVSGILCRFEGASKRVPPIAELQRGRAPASRQRPAASEATDRILRLHLLAPERSPGDLWPRYLRPSTARSSCSLFMLERPSMPIFRASL